MTVSQGSWGAEALWLQLRELLPGLSVEVVERCSSTNTTLLERARVDVRPEADHSDVLVQRSVESKAFGRRAADIQPCLLVAEHQSGGRGRLGRGWSSAPGASLTFSLSLPISRADWSGLSLAVGLALADALDPLAEGAPPRIGLKWPNDLWLMDGPARGRKLGGVLIETVSAGRVRLAVIGIGLNVLPIGNVEASTGFACLQELDAAATAQQTLHRIALPLVQALRRFEAEGFDGFRAGYARRDLLAGHPVRTTQPGVEDGIARGVDAHGALQLQTGAGVVAIHSGEVSVRLAPDADAA
ncbi:biotin--[acetyl-CoA-carboxylase] ligase [Piscinibacter aquaticus]|uniref:biotin--[biotin carboxyl-carrier protein] ligase n=1 Tax=Piscinibacter aquaticus TaxID=392597 RepID=A0A5C6U1T6_9BURK|nr:biotin--[acetyl-CoA-carboxylase] ligase [Piscinibacter aquaticus]